MAACSCGQLAIECPAEPRKVSLCHCRECQRRTGAPFGIAAFFEADATKTSGRSTEFTRASDKGFAVVFHFCPDCGSTVFWYPSRMPTLLAVAVGCFADPDFPAPTQAVYDEQRHPWVPAIPRT